MTSSWAEMADELLDFSREEAPTRALRSAAIYASLFEEDPLLHEWCGLSAFVAKLQHTSLRMGVGFYDSVMADWSRASYDTIVPALLAFRAGAQPEGPLQGPFGLLQAAREARKKDRDQAMALARQGTDALLALEQSSAVQPIFEGKPEIIFRGFGPFVVLSFGATTPDSLAYTGQDFHIAGPRQGWFAQVAMPAFRRAITEDGAGVVQLIRQMQLKGWLSPKELPPR